MIGENTKIQDYGIIGNGRSAALVSKKGSIDWLCWPRFDSPSIFAALLDYQIGGFWKIEPILTARIQRNYIDDTNVLQTHFYTEPGKIILTDFMTAFSEEEKKQHFLPEHELIRIVECLEGETEIKIHFNPRPNYGKDKIFIKDAGILGLRIEMQRELLSLHSNIKFDSVNADGAKVSINLKAGEKINFSLTYSSEAPAVIPPDDLIQFKLLRTIEWWQNWAHQSKYNGSYKKIVTRSALTLKLLGYAPSGAFIAAPTTSLPEQPGGKLNWDYRFCWLRDASFTVRALLGLGYTEEADAFVNWMLHSTRLTLPELKIVYDIYGESMGDEIELNYLNGYENSRPVRIGNAAHNQIQLDVYGEVVDGVDYYVSSGGKLDNDMKRMLRDLGIYICKNWQKKESGIWEERISLEHYTHSRLLCWVVLDKLLKMKNICRLTEKNIKEFEKNRLLIRKEIEDQSWNTEIESYTSILNGKTVDATLLLIPYFEFDSASSLRMQLSFKKIKEKLDAGPGLVYRYEKSINNEGAFLICSFWKIDFITRGGGTLEDANKIFDEVINHTNDLGLFAEEVDVKNGNALGNFPQAFSHLGLINAALSLFEKENL